MLWRKITLHLIANFILLIRYGQFIVSANKHYILRDEKEFLWLSNMTWELFYRGNRDYPNTYLKRRAEQGFIII